MKQYLIFGVMGILCSLFLYVVGCSSTATPVTTTLPKVTYTATPTPPTFPLIYNNGTMATIVTAVNSFSGGGASGYPTLNALDTTVGGYGGDTEGFLSTWTSSEVSAMTGYSGYSLAGSSLNFTGYTTCTFWAKANQNATVGFNAAEPSGDTANVPESLTTTWTQYTINIAQGARTDGNTGAINAVTTYFVCVITAAPGTAPLNVSIDKILFQGAGGGTSTSTFTSTPTGTGATATFTSTPTGTGATATFTSTPTGTGATATFTSTPAGATATPTPGTASFPILFSDGGMSTIVTATDPFSGGGSAGYPTLNALDTTVGGYGGDYYGYLTQWTASEVSAMGGYSGFVLAGSSTNFSSYTTCTFWAKANQSASVAFNAAEPSGDTLSVPESLTTSWAQYTLNIANGTRTDGYSGAITAVTNFFVVVITAAPGSNPLNVSVDQITF